MPRLSDMVQKVPRDRTPRSALSRTLVTSELLDRATELFAAKGYEATTLQEIADSAGMSRSALYHYVDSKEQLLVMLVEFVSQGLAEILAELSARADLTAVVKLRIVTELLVRQRAEHPAQFRILDQSESVLPEPVRTEHKEAKRRVLREVTAVIEDGIETGEFRQVDSRTAALSLFGMCNWVAWWFRPGLDMNAVISDITQFAELMLVAPHLATNGSSSHAAALFVEIKARLELLEQHM